MSSDCEFSDLLVLSEWFSTRNGTKGAAALRSFPSMSGQKWQNWNRWKFQQKNIRCQETNSDLRKYNFTQKRVFSKLICMFRGIFWAKKLKNSENSIFFRTLSERILTDVLITDNVSRGTIWALKSFFLFLSKKFLAGECYRFLRVQKYISNEKNE